MKITLQNDGEKMWDTDKKIPLEVDIVLLWHIHATLSAKKCAPPTQLSANTRRWPDAFSMLDQRLRRWPNIKRASGQRLVFAQSKHTKHSAN